MGSYLNWKEKREASYSGWSVLVPSVCFLSIVCFFQFSATSRKEWEYWHVFTVCMFLLQNRQSEHPRGPQHPVFIWLMSGVSELWLTMLGPGWDSSHEVTLCHNLSSSFRTRRLTWACSSYTAPEHKPCCACSFQAFIHSHPPSFIWPKQATWATPTSRCRKAYSNHRGGDEGGNPLPHS